MENIESTVEEIRQDATDVPVQKKIEDDPTIPVSAYLDDFLAEILSNQRPSAVPTGFGKLDNLLGGGLYAGLYVLGAISSLGKTTFVCQLANQIAAMGKDVLIFSLEMSRKELISKDVSRITGIISLYNSLPGQEALSTLQILYGHNISKNISVLTASFEIYKKISQHIHIIHGKDNVNADTIRVKVNQFVSTTQRTPVVIVDYLQIVSPYSSQYMGDKQNVDKTVLELKRLSRDQDIPIICISSLNRQNYTEPINMSAFKESGSIEYSADVLLGLQLQGIGTKDFDIDRAKRSPNRAVELKILKNRNGPVSDTAHFSYRPKFNLFTESENTETEKSVGILPFPEAKPGRNILEQFVSDHFTTEQITIKNLSQLKH